MNPDAIVRKSGATRFRFGEFLLDVPDRQLWRGDVRLDLNARYFDALVLLVNERDRLVDKDRFFEKVWGEVIVSDSALTQCIKEIRKQLDDDASKPRYVQTVPGHGYRFIADVQPDADEDDLSASTPTRSTEGSTRSDAEADDLREALHDSLYEWGAGTLGGGIAGLFGGLLYGFGIASADAGVGTLSTLLVLVVVNVLVGFAGGFGIGLGLAGSRVAARYAPRARIALRIGGAALGGLVVGGFAKLLGVDAFNLLFGRAPAGITGGPEGAVIGAALAFGAYAGNRLGGRKMPARRWHVAVGAGIGGAAAGVLIPLVGGKLMGGSLDLLARSFSDSHLQLDRFGPLFGELHFGLATEAVLGGIEGLIFGTCVVVALTLVRRLGRSDGSVWQL